MTTMPDDRIPDVMGEVVGWRAWQVVGTLKLPRLMSVNAARTVGHDDAIWPTRRWITARCPHGHVEEIPVEGCTCGLYAAASREQLIQLRYGAYGDGAVHAIGEVGFVGKVIPGSQGWRAERGRIRSLIVPYEHWRYAKPLAEAYRVSVEVGFLFAPEERERALRPSNQKEQ
jgi:hypothetical protein